jgi:hypothetical protein
MAQITKGQIQRVYALGAGIGILENGNENDDLHALVSRITGKEHIKDLTDTEFNAVERELMRLMRYGTRPAPLKKSARRTKPEAVPGMMTPEQQSLAWRMIYRLCELDKQPTAATPGARMVGAINKILGIDATVEAPFRWVDFESGAKLIERLKRYVRSAEKKREAG